MANRTWCWPFLHDWTAYAGPRTVTNYDGKGELGQRRVCKRCQAVDYRRVVISNG